MREMYDCLTCVAAMAFNITYEQARDGLGGNLNPNLPKDEETARVQNAFYALMEQCGCSVLLHVNPVEPALGRRYWVDVQIDDHSNALSQTMGHSIVIDEAGRALDPNSEYGIFKSFSDWSAAMTLTHRVRYVSEFFEFTI